MRLRKREMTDKARNGATLAIGSWRTFGILGLILGATAMVGPWRVR